MLDLIKSLWAEYNTFAKEAPMVASFVSLAAIGSLTYAFKTLPRNIYSFVKRQLMTTLELDNTTSGHAEEIFMEMMAWFESSRYSKYSRTLRVYSAWCNDAKGVFTERTVIGVGDGLQFAMWEGLPVFITRSKLTEGSSNTNKVLYKISITRLGRDRKSLERLLAYFLPKKKDEGISVHHFADNGWQEGLTLQPRSLNTVIASDGVIETITSAIDKFLQSEQWYLDHGIPYKLCIMLKGVPGCGKTSLIRALANHYKRSINAISLNEMCDRSLKTAFNRVPDERFIVMEDFNIASLRARTESLSVNGASTPNLKSNNDDGDKFLFLTLRGVLQVFDGLENIHGKIIFLTTNVYEELDLALIRKGRVDLTVELNMLSDLEVRRYIDLMFVDRIVSNALRFLPITGADLQSLYIDSNDNFDAFIESIPKVQLTGDSAQYVEIHPAGHSVHG